MRLLKLSLFLSLLGADFISASPLGEVDSRNATALVLAENGYKQYTGFAIPDHGWPSIDSWLDFEEMWVVATVMEITG